VKPEWRAVDVPLPKGASVATVRVRPRHSPNSDWFGIGDIRFGNASDPTGARQYRHVISEGSASVYENRHAMPRAFVVHDAIVTATPASALQAIEERGSRLPSGALAVTRFNPRQSAVVEAASSSGLSFNQCDAQRAATVKSMDGDDVIIDVPAGCPGLLVLTDLFYPGWHATVNGKAARIYATDVAFRGVVLPAGATRVHFHYAPASFKVGLSALALGLVAIATAGLYRRRRR
jgi:hypothetical protein